MKQKSAFRITALYLLLLIISLFFFGCGSSTSEPLPLAEETRPHDARTFCVAASSAGPCSADPIATMSFTASAGATAYSGVRPNGAGYRIEVPDNWNGVLVMYAHGYRGNHQFLSITNPAIRVDLIGTRYAWAASTYSKNWYDVRAGIEDTNEPALAFESITGKAKPTKYYIIGHSMGGHIAAAAVEAENIATAKNVVRYAASLPMCGVVGDLSNYFQGFIKAAEQLSGFPPTKFPNEPAFWTSVTFPWIKETLWTNYDGDKNSVTAPGIKLRDILMNLSGGNRPAYTVGWGTYLGTLFGYGSDDGTSSGVLTKPMVDTTGILYRWASTPGDVLPPQEQYFNNVVFRVVPAPDANRLRRDGLRWVPLVSGNFSVPVLTMHDLGDLFVPFVMEQEYRRRAETRGNGARLVQRAIRSASHCGMNVTEMWEAFQALAAWEGGGAAPAGDDILTPAVLAAANYGCQFTKATRAGIPACP